MALFESYERRIPQIQALLDRYGIASLEEARKITATLPSTMRPAKTIVRHEDFAKSPSMKIIRGKENTAT